MKDVRLSINPSFLGHLDGLSPNNLLLLKRDWVPDMFLTEVPLVNGPASLPLIKASARDCHELLFGGPF